MKRSHIFLFGVGAVLATIASCSAAPRDRSFKDDDDKGNGGAGGSGTTTMSTGEGVGGFNPVGSGGGTPGCANAPDIDGDQDGFSFNEGDCNDCDPVANPGSVEVINPDPAAPKSDEDCSGMADDVMDVCDMGLNVDDTDPYRGAKAIDVCQTATANDKKWGVLDASYVTADGQKTVGDLRVGILDKFGTGVNVQGGSSMLMLSSGAARVPGQPGECLSQTCFYGPGTAPPNFPQDVPNCDGDTEINDDIGLELKIRTPRNATGYSFLFKFYSFEFSEYVCTSYNDQFIALASPAPMGAIDGNISFDSKKNPVSVNIAFFDACDPNTIDSFALFCLSGCPAPPNPYCPLGPGELAGTGFDTWGDAGGTSWLQTQAPVTGGEELTLRFAIWDTGDMALDSSVLLDQFRWVAGAGVTVGTAPIPDPK